MRYVGYIQNKVNALVTESLKDAIEIYILTGDEVKTIEHVDEGIQMAVSWLNSTGYLDSSDMMNEFTKIRQTLIPALNNVIMRIKYPVENVHQCDSLIDCAVEYLNDEHIFIKFVTKDNL